MKQICNEEYWKGMESIRDRNPEAPCGRSFDDLHQSTQCPHKVLPHASPFFDPPYKSREK